MTTAMQASRQVCRGDTTHDDWIFTLATFRNTSGTARDLVFPRTPLWPGRKGLPSSTSEG
jgi:hypothetical protein